MTNEKVIYSPAECVAAFCELMNERAKRIGMKNTVFRDPVGINNDLTARDMVYCISEAYKYSALDGIWNKAEWEVDVKGENPRKEKVVSTVVASDVSHIFTDKYKIIGGKTGTLSRCKAYNLTAITEAPDGERLAFTVYYADEPNTAEKHRFLAAKEAVDAAILAHKGEDNSDCEVCAKYVAVAKISDDGVEFLYEKDADTVCQGASTSKIMTAMLALDYIGNLDEKLEIIAEDNEALASYTGLGNFKQSVFFDKDVITLRDALYAALLPSNNLCPMLIARIVGEKILRERE